MNLNKTILKELLLLLVVFVMAISCKKDDSDSLEEKNTVTFGALLPLTGPDADEGQMAKSAIDCAINDLNDFMAEVGSSNRYACLIKDMQSDSAVCLQKVKEFAGKGIKLLLGGPYNSDELSAIKSYLDNNEMLMLNAYSTSPALSIAGDNIFRLLPDDAKQAKAHVGLLQSDSISAIVPIYVNDLYGNGLVQKIKSGFQLTGGTVWTGVSFSPGQDDFSVLVASLNTQVVEAKSQFGADKVAVILITGEETLPIFNLALTYPDLGSVRWIGSDGSACQNNVLEQPLAAQFAINVDFIASVYEVGMKRSGSYIPEVQDIMDRILAATGHIPNSNTLNVYDALKIYSMVYQAVGNESAANFKKGLPVICKTFCTGDLTSRELNDAGDIAKPIYGFWGVTQSGGIYKWKIKAHYFSEENKIEFIKP